MKILGLDDDVPACTAGPHAACGDAGLAGAGPIGPGDPAFILGADISWTLEDERAGARYFDRGEQQDLVQILRRYGFNYVRLRTFVNPATVGGYASAGLEPWNDLEHTIEMARRVRAKDMGLLLNFHYSDTWADPGHQSKPSAWNDLPFEALVDRAQQYTRDSLLAMRAAGVSPQMVQVGNEITSGLLHPDGASTDENWPRLATLLRACVAAVRETEPEVRVILQLDKCNDTAATAWWVDRALQNGVEFDALAQSCYTAYQGEPSEWRANFADLVQRYPHLDFVIGEYSHEKRAANDIMFGLPGRRGLGTFIWEPTRWMESIFTRERERDYSTNSLIELYSQMASDYGL
jgi:arabinogalactan endo-1,4-beta-galactosidase